MAFFLSSLTFAGILIEPFAGFGVGSGEFEESGVTVDHKYSAPQFGARFGYQVLGLMAGLEYRRTSGTLKYSTHSGGGLQANAGTKQKYSGTEYGIFVGYNFPILARAYISYSFDTSWDFDVENAFIGGKDDELTGKTTTLGVGFTGIPFVSVNLEYRIISHSKLKDGMTGVESPSFDHDTNEVVLGISVPFDIL